MHNRSTIGFVTKAMIDRPSSSSKGAERFGFAIQLREVVIVDCIVINTSTMAGCDTRQDQYLLTSGTGISHHRSRRQRAGICINT
jgi:hypothetical protein